MSSQQEAIEKLFEKEEYSNHIQAFYLQQIGEELCRNCPAKLQKIFPKDIGDDTKEWENAYNIALSYLNSKGMLKTSSIVSGFSSNTQIVGQDSLAEELKLDVSRSNGDLLIELVKTHKIRHLLDPKSVDFPLDPDCFNPTEE